MMRNWVRAVAVAAIVGAGGMAMPASPAQAKAASMLDCFVDLERGTSPEIACEFPLKPSPAERAEMEKQTAGYLKDATCTVSIRVLRSLVTEAINTPEFVFQAPPQPVACNITMPGKTGDTIVPITASFAPKVTIKGGVAMQASPGLGEVKGVTRVISWPAVAYINRAGFLQTGMLKIVNAWMGHMRTGSAKTAGK